MTLARLPGPCARCNDSRTILTQIGVHPCPICAELPADALTRGTKGVVARHRLPSLLQAADHAYGRDEFIPPCPPLAPLMRLAWAHGYALAVHGSLERDLDLVAVPWTSDAVSPEALVDAFIDQGGLSQHGPWVDKPHGRRALSLRYTGRWSKVIDLSILPRQATTCPS
ncbi:hypothetical protein [uncultured Deinococcus sp.]|uniref:hypothetical protein n=1 Tax=uncultured Deinococcus sp. TaxID=158789 RepID=UPI0025F9FC07|nr:hypothetical protein [uncultured Deinococcus sp.]